MANYGQSVSRATGSDPLVPEPVKGRKKMATPDAATMRKLQSQGKAIKNAKGEPSFQIRNGTDLDNAIRAIGRVRPNTEAARAKVRRYVIGRARSLGLTSKIPDTWASDGSLKSGGDGSSSSGSSSQSGSSGPAKAGNSSSSSGSDSDDVAAAAKKLQAKGMSPKAARIFAARAARRKAA